ncbi:MAG: D-lyxose/D-mannose family sugar isomerase, partial [Victivallaceae bacterium]|nr:D-lyxose/D-mannose family sugar isomerase [Victivallaceae bacterium]
YWTPAYWTARGTEANEIRDNLLGWDITDFGTGDFRNCGLALFTLRNGNVKNPQYRKPYAEKIMIIEEEQRTPMHFHFYKMEDIINRGGGTLLLELYNSTGNGQLDKEKPVRVSLDGVEREFAPGETIRLAVGESITLPPYLYHSFYAEKGQGTVLSGEVSMVNDDSADNRFLELMGRFPEIEEDEPALYYLCSEIPQPVDG